MTTINYICSLGPRCHTAGFLKRNNLKKASYPFDWIFCNTNMILHCLEDDFNIFLDKKYFTILDNNSPIQQHKLYSECENEILFNHHNPLNIKDYSYFKRCILRFKNLLLKPELKLFILTFLNYTTVNIGFKNKIIDFNKKFSKYTQNYGILCIIQYKADKRAYRFNFHENIHFLEIYTKSNSNGLEFEDKEDNDFLDKLITSTYEIYLKDIEEVQYKEEEEKEEKKEKEEKEEVKEVKEEKEEVKEVKEEKKEEKEEKEEEVKEKEEEGKKEVKEEKEEKEEEKEEIKQIMNKIIKELEIRFLSA